jgi:hypothetical protein
MIDIILFSKDRPLQLYTSIESILKFVKGYNKLYVMFNYSTEEYLESYRKLNDLTKFSEVIFVNEQEYGFQATFKGVIDLLEGEYLMMEIDDAVYCDEVDLEKHSLLLDNELCGRVNFTADYKIYNPDYYQDREGYVVVDRFKILELSQTNETLCLHYPFNVSSTVHRVQDVRELINTNDINNPFQLEWKGSDSPIFKKYQFNHLIKTEGPVVRQLHINNFLNRYETYYTTEDLHKLFQEGLVFDLDFTILKNSKQTLDWLRNETQDSRFPIFPWDVNPEEYQTLLAKTKRYNND